MSIKKDYSACATFEELDKLSKQTLIEIVMKQERHNTDFTRKISQLKDENRRLKTEIAYTNNSVREYQAINEKLKSRL